MSTNRLQGSWTKTDRSAANTAKDITQAGARDKTYYITAIEVIMIGGAAANDIFVQLKDGATVVWEEAIGTGEASGARCGIVFTNPVQLTKGNDAVLSVSTGGANVVTILNMAGYTD